MPYYDIKCNHPMNFHFSSQRMNGLQIHQTSTHLTIVWGAVVQAFHKLQSKPKTIPELKSAPQQIWDDLPQTTINKAINDFRKRLERMRLGHWWTF